MMNPYSAPAPEGPYGNPPAGGYGGGVPGGVTGDRADVTEMAVEMLRQTKPWVMFLSVMSFLGSAFMLLGGIFMIVAGAFVPTGAAGMSTSALGFVYLPMAFLYIYPALKLWGFGGAIARLTQSRSSMDLEAALAQQKSFWKFAGITTIVMMVLYGLFFIGIIVVGVAAAGGAH